MTCTDYNCPPPPSTGTTTTTTTTPAGALAHTGDDIVPALIGGFAGILVGCAVLVAAAKIRFRR